MGLAESAFAQQMYSGTLVKEKAKIYLLDDAKVTHLLKSDDKTVYNTLLSLETGDSVVLSGKQTGEQIIYVESLLRVGIQKILGMWMGKDEFLKFDNFDDFRSFEPNFENNKLVGIFAQKFRYYLIPDSSGRFVISYTNSQSYEIAAATISLSETKLAIDMIDNNTGKVKERKKYDRIINKEVSFANPK